MKSNSLADITYKKLIETLPQDVIDTLVEYALEFRKRDTVLTSRITGGDIEILGQWKNVTKVELARKIMSDATLGYSCENGPPCRLFYDLLYHNRKLLKGHSIFNKKELDKRVGLYSAKTSIIRGSKSNLTWITGYHLFDAWTIDPCNVEPELIQYLYTEILTPERLLKDIEEVYILDAFFICFEDEASWRCAKFTNCE